MLNSFASTSPLLTQLYDLFPGGVNSPVRAFRALNRPPIIMHSAKGGHITDVNGRSYLDFCGNWGAALLGHAHPAITRVAYEQINEGIALGMTSAWEAELAALLVNLIPSLGKVRFVSTGTEATMTALRLARGFTGRSKILKFAGCYHGHSDALLVEAGSGALGLSQASSSGIPSGAVADTLVLPFNDLTALEALFSSAVAQEIASVIVEPVPGNMGVLPPKPHFLERLRELTSLHGTVLIFDEIITGFRLSLLGAQGLFDIQPDLSCFGKALGGGMPLACVGGRKEIMDCLAPAGKVYQAGTFAGYPLGVRCALAAIQEYQRPSFYTELAAKTERFLAPIRECLKKFKTGCLHEVGSMWTLFVGVDAIRSLDELKNLPKEPFAHMFSYLLDRGIYLSPLQQEACFISIAHTEEELDYASDCIVKYIETM